jgi:glycine oxidase
MRVLVKGAGVAGLAVAHELASRGVCVAVTDPRQSLAETASWFAGAMLAPYCEREDAEQVVQDLGLGAADWWDKVLPGCVSRAGTLVVAPARDTSELDRFSSRTSGFKRLSLNEITALEPDLGGRFRQGLYFRQEAHLDPRAVLTGLQEKLAAMGVSFDSALGDGRGSRFNFTVDCTGMARAHADLALRGVRGEMLILHTRDVTLSRPVRLLHPRFPIYVVPRADHHFMVGATAIESAAAGPITARSMMELLNAAYSLHSAFGEAEIIETGVGVRPAYPDNLPRVEKDGATIRVNGLYRHGFLLAPAMALKAAKLIFSDHSITEFSHETDDQRRSAGGVRCDACGPVVRTRV